MWTENEEPFQMTFPKLLRFLAVYLTEVPESSGKPLIKSWLICLKRFVRDEFLKPGQLSESQCISRKALHYCDKILARSRNGKVRATRAVASIFCRTEPLKLWMKGFATVNETSVQGISVAKRDSLSVFSPTIILCYT